MLTALAMLASRIGGWLNARLNLVANEEDSLYYDWADQYLDGLTTLTFEEWMEKRNAVA